MAGLIVCPLAGISSQRGERPFANHLGVAEKAKEEKEGYSKPKDIHSFTQDWMTHIHPG